MNFTSLVISREQVRQIVKGTDAYELLLRRYGRQAADNELGGRGAGVQTTRPLERVEIDHTLCDVHLVDERTGKRIGRPWLTLVVDHYSGAILGYRYLLDEQQALVDRLTMADLEQKDRRGEPASDVAKPADLG